MQAMENEKAILVGVCLDSENYKDKLVSLNELEQLAFTVGVETIGKYIQNRKQIDKTFYFGKGFLGKIKEKMEESGAELLIFDNELSPGHARNIRKHFSIDIADRTEIILNIFHDHARTKEARLQVGLAEMKYQLPRLKKLWSHLDKERGSARASGGAAFRGMGEKQIEIDKRKVNEKIKRIHQGLKKTMRQKKTQRKQRQNIRKACLVGYTNAGKSTLFNKLTYAGVLVEDKLFSTLDSTARKLHLEKGREIILSDTVGFISNLPHHLVASFHATLLDVQDADLLLHIVDISDVDFKKNINEVNKVLKKIDSENIPQILILNKIDRKNEIKKELFKETHENAIKISAKTGENVSELLKMIDEHLHSSRERNLFIPHTEQRIINNLFKLGQILEKEYLEDGVKITAILNQEDMREFEKFEVK